MSYVSIALLRWSGESKNKNHNNKNAKFLVLKEKGTWKFWGCNMNAIGAHFKRDWFEKQLTNYFDFDFEGAEFKYVDSREYQGEKFPPCSAYVIDLSLSLYKVIDHCFPICHNPSVSTSRYLEAICRGFVYIH